MGKAHNDIRVTCNHGIRDGHEDFVQRFRYFDDQGVWAPTRRRTADSVNLVENDVENPEAVLDPDYKPAGPVRETVTIRCDRCPGRKGEVQARNERLQLVLRLLDRAGMRSVPLDGLRSAVAAVPRPPAHPAGC